jgi:hypothetical protein
MRTVKCINVEILNGNSIAPPLELGKKYPVEGAHTCGCGETHLDVGLVTNMNLPDTDIPDPDRYVVNYVTCHKCREKLPGSETDQPYPTWWAHSSRFEDAAD